MEDEPQGDYPLRASNCKRYRLTSRNNLRRCTPVKPPEDHAGKSRSCGKGKIPSVRCRGVPFSLRGPDGRSTPSTGDVTSSLCHYLHHRDQLHGSHFGSVTADIVSPPWLEWDCRHPGGPPSAWDNRRGMRNGSRTRTSASSASRRWTCSNQNYAWRGYCHSCSRAISFG